MLKQIYEYTFEVTETCNNGKERTFKKKVYADHPYRVDEARAELKARWYYNILFEGARLVKVLTVGDL